MKSLAFAIALALSSVSASAQAIYTTTQRPYGNTGTETITRSSTGSETITRTTRDDNGAWHSSTTYTPAPSTTPSRAYNNGNYGQKYCPLGRC